MEKPAADLDVHKSRVIMQADALRFKFCQNRRKVGRYTQEVVGAIQCFDEAGAFDMQFLETVWPAYHLLEVDPVTFWSS